MSADQPVVITRELTKVYGDLTALDRLSIELYRGQILGFIGPNGAGKTTTIKILVGLALPTSGSASVAGADCVRETRRIKQLVGYMPDAFGSYDNMRVWEYLDFFGAAFGIPRTPRQKRIDEVMDLAGCTYMRDLFVESLSHGMKQRVGIARTLLHNPEVLILDEPANGLDPQARIEMRHILLRLAEAKKTLIVTSHVLPELSRICDRVAIITKGKLRAFGTVEEIMTRVSQRRTIEVQLTEAAPLSEAEDVIRQHLTADTEIESSPTEAVLRFATDQPENSMSVLLAQLVRAQVPVTQFREVQTDLEDAFLSVTREEADAAAGPAPANDPGVSS